MMSRAQHQMERWDGEVGRSTGYLVDQLASFQEAAGLHRWRKGRSCHSWSATSAGSTAAQGRSWKQLLLGEILACPGCNLVPVMDFPGTIQVTCDDNEAPLGS